MATQHLAVESGSTSSLSTIAAAKNTAKLEQQPQQPTSADDSRKRQRRRHVIFIGAGIMVVVILALVIGLAVGLTRAASARQSQHEVKDQQQDSIPGYTTSFAIPTHATPTFTGAVAPTSTSDPLSFSFSEFPIRLGLLTNFPDPSIYYNAAEKLWYAYGTNDAAGILRSGPNQTSFQTALANVQIATSKDFVDWTLKADANSDPLPTPGDWVVKGKGSPTQLLSTFTTMQSTRTSTRTINTAAAATVAVSLANVWAPDVIQNPYSSKSWLMYYSAASAQSPQHHCIGAAFGPSPSGPFSAVSTPLACPLSEGGAIDAAAFVEPANKTLYVVYKVDGNSIGRGGECGNTVAPLVPTPLRLQQMLTDGITPDPAHKPVTLLDRIAEDGPLVEAPALAKIGPVYFLFYSSGCTRAPDYTVRYAYADRLEGPYTRHSEPLFKTGDYGLLAPGSASVRYAASSSNSSSTGGEGLEEYSASSTPSLTAGWKIALHGRVPTNVGGVRALFTAGLGVGSDGKTLVLSDGSISTL